MQLRPLVLALGIAVALGLAAVGIVVSAESITVDEADLTSYGKVWDINRDADGNLYISDYDAWEIWQVHPTGAYTLYQGVDYATDAQPDDAGDIWWTDAAQSFGRVNVLSDTLTTWTLEETQLYGLAFDNDGQVWLTNSPGSNIYRFSPASTEVCTYTLPGGSNSDYILYLYQSGHLWLGNYSKQRIVRFNPGNNEIAWWEIGDITSFPEGLAVDANDNLWWADNGLGVLARLQPATNQRTTYTLPVGSEPRMIAIDEHSVWYTETDAGTVGKLDPRIAAGTTTTLSTGTGSATSTCSTLGAGITSAVTSSTGTLSWTSNTWESTQYSGGWTVYQLPTGAYPYGIAISTDYVWVADQGRQKLARFSTPPEYSNYVPLVLKNMQP